MRSNTIIDREHNDQDAHEFSPPSSHWTTGERHSCKQIMSETAAASLILSTGLLSILGRNLQYGPSSFVCRNGQHPENILETKKASPQAAESCRRQLEDAMFSYDVNSTLISIGGVLTADAVLGSMSSNPNSIGRQGNAEKRKEREACNARCMMCEG